MVQKTYFKTKDYCKVKFTFNVENAETVEILGLNSDWKNAVGSDRMANSYLGGQRQPKSVLVEDTN